MHFTTGQTLELSHSQPGLYSYFFFSSIFLRRKLLEKDLYGARIERDIGPRDLNRFKSTIPKASYIRYISVDRYFCLFKATKL